MNLFILSDLHIDTGDNFGTFQWDETELILQIERIRESYSIDKVIFNGDSFELLKYSVQDIKKAYPRLMEYLKRNDFIFIKGNHDIVLESGLSHYQITNSVGQTIHIEHGHNADRFNGSRLGRFISRSGFYLLNKLSGFKFLMDIYFKIVEAEEHLYHIPKRYNTIKYLIFALRLLKEYDVVILGHTHKLEAHHTYYLNKKKRYLNCGSCSLGRFEGIILDTETLKYELIKERKESFQEVWHMRYAI